MLRPVDRHGNVGDRRITDRGVALVVKQRAELATAAATAGVHERVIAQTTGHKSMSVLGRYIREGNLFNENAATAVGL